MKRCIKPALVVVLVLCMLAVGAKEMLRRDLFAGLQSKAEFSGWRVLGRVVGDGVGPGTPFAYPTEVVIFDVPDRPESIAARLYAMPGLKTLRIYIREQDVPAELLKGVNHSSIKVLDLDGARVDESVFDALQGARHLEELILTGTKIRLLRPVGLSKLQKLWADNTAIDDAGMDYIGNLSELTSLNLSWTKVSTIDVQRVRKLRRLKYLYIDNTNIPPELAEHVSKELPEVSVSY